MHYGCQIPANQHGFAKIPCIMTNMHYDVMHYEQVNCTIIPTHFPVSLYCERINQLSAVAATSARSFSHANSSPVILLVNLVLITDSENSESVRWNWSPLIFGYQWQFLSGGVLFCIQSSIVIFFWLGRGPKGLCRLCLDLLCHGNLDTI